MSRAGSTVHKCPSGDSGTMPCCGRTPFEVPRTDRMTLDDNLVTCEDEQARIEGRFGEYHRGR